MATGFGRACRQRHDIHGSNVAGDDRTVVIHHAEARVRGLLRLLEPAIERVAERERGRTLEALKESFR